MEAGRYLRAKSPSVVVVEKQERSLAVSHKKQSPHFFKEAAVADFVLVNDDAFRPPKLEEKQAQSKSVVQVVKPPSLLGRKVTPQKDKVRNPAFHDDGEPQVQDISIDKIQDRSFADIVIDEAVSEEE